MNLRDDLNALTPRLRRYARALISGRPDRCERADNLVHATLMRALNARNIGLHTDLVVRLYATLTQLHRDIAVTPSGERVAALTPRAAHGSSFAFSTARQSKLAMSLMNLPLEDREALLLVALEGFSHDEAARILHVTRTTVLHRLTRARLTLDGRLHLVAETQPRELRERERATPHLRLVK